MTRLPSRNTVVPWNANWRCVFLVKSENGFCVLLTKSKKWSWIQSIHTNSGFLSFTTLGFFSGKGSEKLGVRFLEKSENGSWIQSIHTRGVYFGLNLNSDFWDSPPQRFSGKDWKKYFWQAVFYAKMIHNSHRTWRLSPKVFLIFTARSKTRIGRKWLGFLQISHQKLH